ncbi:MAG TPA: exodeoxyribonuclease VII small subunit [Phaeodactylibacter sp.]|nr:exodeoxyribonuclease VII small subunit [Phaeodactylibacter sp.]
MTKQTMTYESALEELQQVVEDLRNEMISIDQITTKVARAKELIELCKNKLRKVESELE